MVDADDVLLRRAVAEPLRERRAVRVGCMSGQACCFVASGHGADTARVCNALDVRVQPVSGEGMPPESFHDSSRLLVFRASAAVYQPVNLYCREVFHPAQEGRDVGVFHGHDELIKVDYGNPARFQPVALEAVVVCGELHLLPREVGIVYQARRNVGSKHAAGFVGASVVVDVEFLDSLLAVPFNPFFEIRPFVFGDGAHCQVIFGRGGVALHPPFQLPCA